jgi:tetratricopeptide (TPR) repeat protein
MDWQYQVELGRQCLKHNDSEGALHLLGRAMCTLYQPPPEDEVELLQLLAKAKFNLGQLGEARGFLEEALAIMFASPRSFDRSDHALCLIDLGEVLLYQREYPLADETLSRAMVSLLHPPLDRTATGRCAVLLADASFALGDIDQAQRYATEGLRLARTAANGTADLSLVASALCVQALVLLVERRGTAAQAAIVNAFQLVQALPKNDAAWTYVDFALRHLSQLVEVN